MKLRTLAAIATLVACGSAPAASSPTSSTNPKPNVLSDQTQTTSAQTKEATPSNATATTATAGNHIGDVPNAARAREAGEATPPPPKVNGSHGGYPKTPQPAPTNTGDPCGWCKSPDGR